MVKYKPMKAVDMTKRLDEIRFPVFATVKLDGVRCYMTDEGKLISTGGHEFPQAKVQGDDILSRSHHSEIMPGMEYEIIGDSLGAAEIAGIMNRKAASDDFKKLKFAFIMDYGYDDSRYSVPGVIINCPTELDAYIADYLNEEGIMLRGGDLTYKHGRATAKCQRLMKIKFRSECQAQLVDWKYAHVAGQGWIITKLHFTVLDGEFEGLTIVVGAATDELRRSAHNCKGRIAEIEYQAYGNVKSPRQPVFKRWIGDV